MVQGAYVYHGLRGDLCGSSRVLVRGLTFYGVCGVIGTTSFVRTGYGESILVFISGEGFRFVAVYFSSQTFFGALPSVVAVGHHVRRYVSLHFLRLRLLFVQRVLVDTSTASSGVQAYQLAFFQ